MLSEVSASAARLARLALPDQSAPDQSAQEFGDITKDWPDWRKASVTLCIVGDDGVICEGLAYDRDSGLLFA